MKKITYIIIICSLILCSCEKEVPVASDSFRIYGTIKGLETEFMTYGYKDESGNRKWDSIMVENEHFDFTTKISAPTHISLWPNVKRTVKSTKSGGYYPVKSSQLAFFASPGSTIQFTGEVTDFMNVYPSGNESNNDLAKINQKIFPLMNKSVNLLLQKENYDKDDPILVKIDDSVKILDDQVIQLKKEFLKDNPKSKAAIWYLSDMMMRSQISDAEAIKYYEAVDPNLNGTPYYKEVETRIKGIASSKIGTVLADFTKQNVMSHESFSLSSTRGKYVLIDFWGTWCGPCVAEMPTVKTYQEKYKDQLVVIGINSGDTEEKLKDFVEKNGYDWTQLMVDNNDLVLALNVTGFPTKFILDPEGKIVFRLLGDGPESFAKLDELLGEI